MITDPRIDVPQIPLSDDELAAFAALLKALITADARVSFQEEDRLAHLIAHVGMVTFGEAPDLDAEDDAAVLAWAARITRPEARAEVHRVLTSAAEVDGLVPEESRFLAVVAEAWDL